MDAQEKRPEIEPSVAHDDDLAVESATRGKLPGERREKLRKVAVHRLLVAALKQDLVSVAKHDRPKAVPLGLELPPLPFRQGIRRGGQHRRERGIERQAHRPIVPAGKGSGRKRRRRAARPGAWRDGTSWDSRPARGRRPDHTWGCSSPRCSPLASPWTPGRRPRSPCPAPAFRESSSWDASCCIHYN